MGNKNLIFNYIFLGCLIILFLNDHFFKFQFTSWFTGKLSDIVGIILLPMLLTYLFPRLKQNSVFVAGLFFIFWKSPFSEIFINLYNLISPISIHRVIDYSDLAVLLLLPIPYILIKNISLLEQFSVKKINSFVVLLPALLVLMSTSQPKSYTYSPETGMLTFNNDIRFEVKKTKIELINEIRNQNLVIVKDTAYILESSRFIVSRMGKFDQGAIKNDGDIFKVDNADLKKVLLKEIEESSDYKITELAIGERTVKNLRFSIGPAFDKISPKKFSEIVVHGVQIDKNLDNDKVGARLREIYKSVITNKFKNF